MQLARDPVPLVADRLVADQLLLAGELLATASRASARSGRRRTAGSPATARRRRRSSRARRRGRRRSRRRPAAATSAERDQPAAAGQVAAEAVDAEDVEEDRRRPPRPSGCRSAGSAIRRSRPSGDGDQRQASAEDQQHAAATASSPTDATQPSVPSEASSAAPTASSSAGQPGVPPADAASLLHASERTADGGARASNPGWRADPTPGLTIAAPSPARRSSRPTDRRRRHARSRHERRIGRFAWVMAWVGLVVGQLHALARFATADGKEDLELPLTAAWAEPAADAALAAAGLGGPGHRLRHLREDLVPGVRRVHALRVRRLPPPAAGRVREVGVAGDDRGVRRGLRRRLPRLLDPVDRQLQRRRHRGRAVHGRAGS